MRRFYEFRDFGKGFAYYTLSFFWSTARPLTSIFYIVLQKVPFTRHVTRRVQPRQKARGGPYFDAKVFKSMLLKSFLVRPLAGPPRPNKKPNTLSSLEAEVGPLRPNKKLNAFSSLEGRGWTPPPTPGQKTQRPRKPRKARQARIL